MKKSLIVLTFALCMPLVSVAQKSWSPARELDAKLSCTTFPGNDGADLGIKADYNFYLTDHFSIGGGMGVDVPTSGEGMFVPMTLNLGYHFPMRKVAPYLSLQTGPLFVFAFGDNEFVMASTGILSPSAGVKIPIANNVALDLSLGYMRYGLFESGTNGIVFRAGFSFGYSHRGSSHAKRLGESGVGSNADGSYENAVAESAARNRNAAASVHGGFCAGAEAEYFTSASDGGENRMHAMYGVRGYALWNAFVKNLYAGITLGLGVADYEQTILDYNYSDRHKQIRCTVMPRVRYNVGAATIAGRVYPFAQVDAGFAYNGVHCQFAAEPSAGLSVKTKDGQSLDFSVGYLPEIDFGSGYKTDGGSVRLAVGYTF